MQRFISEDPGGFRGGIDLYAYVGNDPTNHTDPLGLQRRDPLASRALDDWPSPWPRGEEPWQRVRPPESIRPETPRIFDKNGQPIDTTKDPYENAGRRFGAPNANDEIRGTRPPGNFNPDAPSRPGRPYPGDGSWGEKAKWAGGKVLDLLRPLFEHFGAGSNDFFILITPPDVIENEMRRGRRCLTMQSYFQRLPGSPKRDSIETLSPDDPSGDIGHTRLQ